MYSHEEIRAMREKITSGPWEQSSGSVRTPIERDFELICDVYTKNEVDVVFIAAAPAIIDQLLEEREALKKKIEGMKKSWDGYMSIEKMNGYNQAISDVLALLEE